MLEQAFEITIALLGHVSVGKTTVLNALLGEKYSEVSMRRTTSGINHFRISYDIKTSLSSDEDDKDFKSTNDIYSQIKTDNNLLREENTIKETTFDIKLGQQLFTMRDDTRLVLTDIPGINEAHASEKYLNYVKKEWKSFDW